MTTETFTIDDGAHGSRVDVACARAFDDMSRSRLKSLICDGRLHVKRDDATRRIIDPAWVVRRGDILTIEFPPPEDSHFEPQKMDLDILHEDDDVIVINKPAGLVIHPAPGNMKDTLVNGLLAHCKDSLSGIGGALRPGIVHRLDKNTSGVLVAAKNDAAHNGLAAQFAAHGRDGQLERHYIGLIWGSPRPTQGTISTGFGRDAHNWRKMAVLKNDEGKRAITHYQILPSFTAPPTTVLRNKAAVRPAGSFITPMQFRLETGRTHQIRVHMTHLKHPIIGDTLYGAGWTKRTRRMPQSLFAPLANLKRQALHAQTLSFIHPATKTRMSFSAPIPDDMQTLINVITS